jgi:hypothetical protein
MTQIRVLWASDTPKKVVYSEKNPGEPPWWVFALPYWMGIQRFLSLVPENLPVVIVFELFVVSSYFPDLYDIPVSARRVSLLISPPLDKYAQWLHCFLLVWNNYHGRMFHAGRARNVDASS